MKRDLSSPEVDFSSQRWISAPSAGFEVPELDLSSPELDLGSPELDLGSPELDLGSPDLPSGPLGSWGRVLGFWSRTPAAPHAWRRQPGASNPALTCLPDVTYGRPKS